MSKQYEAAIAELTKTLGKNTKRALKSVRVAADVAQAANPVKGKKNKKKKKNTIHKIFLSEEQQNVLNLVTEYKKSVFFTGSAGIWSKLFVEACANNDRYR